MADEARLNELLDLVEQARNEGDKATEAKAVAAYKRESGPAGPAGPAAQPFPDVYAGAGGYNPMMSRVQGAAKTLFEPLGVTDENSQNAMANAAGPLESVAQAATGMAGNAAGLFAKYAPMAMSPGSFATEAITHAGEDRKQAVQNAMTYQPRSGVGQGMSRVASAIPNYVMGKAEQYGGPVARDALEAAMLAEGVRGMGKGGAVEPPRGAPVSSAPKAPIPNTAELHAAKDALYKAADDANVVIRPASTKKAVEIFRSVAKTENLGELPTELNKAVKILEKRLDVNEPLSLSDADKVRQRINDATKSTDPADQRLGMVVKKHYDNYLDSLGADDVLSGNTKEGIALLKSAREMNGRLKRSETLDEMDDIGSLRGDVNYTQAGHEHALRKQYQGLAERAIKGDEHLTPAQLAAVRKVAAPGPGANMLRNLGKVDPTRGPMAGGLNAVIGGSLGGAIGSLFGPAGTGAGVMAGQAGLGVAAHVANRAALRGTVGRVASAREALVGRGLPEVSAKKSVFEPIAQPAKAAAEEPRAAAPAVRSSSQIKLELQRLLVQMRSHQGEVDPLYAQGLERRWGQLQAELTQQLSRESSSASSARKPTK